MTKCPLAACNAFWDSMRVKWTVGRVDAIHDNAYTYLPPLQPASKYCVMQTTAILVILVRQGMLSILPRL